MVSTSRTIIARFAAFLIAALPAAVTAQPTVEVRDVRRVFDDGDHDAFTDLCRYRERFWLTFRSCPDGHSVHPTSSIIVLVSDDARTWREAHRFRVPKRDTRDPHFLVFGEKLFVYTGTWYCGDTSPESYDMNRQLGYAVWTDDGSAWRGPRMLEGTYGHYIWRAATFEGRVYLCGRRGREFIEGARSRRELIESAMLESDDGLVFRTRSLFQESWGDETAFLFEPDGSILAVARRGRREAELCRSEPPWTEWKRADLDRYIGGPVLARWGGGYVVGGREITDDRPRTFLAWLVDGELRKFAELPSGGDTSYPGFVALGPDRALVSWYSSHEEDDAGDTRTAIYLAELRITTE